MDLMKDSFVGRLQILDHLDTLKDNFFLGGMTFLKVRYLGDNVVLITSLDGIKLTNVIEGNNNWFATMFKSFIPWSRDQVSSYKLVWLRCYGLPLTLWNK